MPTSSPRLPSRPRRALQIVQTELGGLTSRALIGLGAVLAVCTLLSPAPWPVKLVGAAAGAASLVALVSRRWKQITRPAGSGLLGYFVTARALLLIAVGGVADTRGVGSGWLWAGVGVALALVVCEPLVAVVLKTPKVAFAHVPGVAKIPPLSLAPSWVGVINMATIALGAVIATAGLPGWLLLVVALAGAPVSAAVLASAIRRTLASKRADRGIQPALERLQPEFAVYYAAVTGAQYQLGMWLPYLERLNRPFVVITRSPQTVPTIAKLTSAPVVVPKPGREMSARLDAMVVPSMRAAFYVQGSPGNQTFQRYHRLTHVWLNHGDSDKQANFHPRHASYDKLFVSGQQGVDRYAAHGIEVAPEKFAIVGRPQIESIQVRDQLLPAGAPRTVLYAPTWKGGRPSTNYSSLPVGEAIVTALLARGSTVIFRPHPLSYNDKADAARIRAIHARLQEDQRAHGRPHVWGRKAETTWDVAACFNASDALVTDVSSIASDYLASGKPFAMVAVTAGGDAFRNEFPMSRVAYLIEFDLSTLDAVLDHLHAADPAGDPLAEPRRAYRTYCLGEHLGAEAPKEFLRVAGDIVAGREASLR